MYAAFTMLPVRERSLGVKTMQNCSGAPIWLMWLAQYVWDFLNCLPSIALTLIIFAASQKVEGMKTFVETLDVIFVLFLFFTFAMLPFGYCWSFMFDTAASALTYCKSYDLSSSSEFRNSLIISYAVKFPFLPKRSNGFKKSSLTLTLRRPTCQS